MPKTDQVGPWSRGAKATRAATSNTLIRGLIMEAMMLDSDFSLSSDTTLAAIVQIVDKVQ